MAEHNLLGKKGEELAAAFLTSKGYHILHRNWRYSYFEIDIIATKDSKLHFVEVKMRTSMRYGMPEDSVTKRKFKKLLAAADEFLHLHPQYRHVQYDVLSITKLVKSPIEYFLIEDIYL